MFCRILYRRTCRIFFLRTWGDMLNIPALSLGLNSVVLCRHYRVKPPTLGSSQEKKPPHKSIVETTVTMRNWLCPSRRFFQLFTITVWF